MMRCKLLLIFLVLSLPVWADDEVRDSVRVEEVEIKASRLSHFSVTDRVEELDSLSLQRYASQDLGALLQKTTLINIQSNGGVGALTTANIRGASSNHTLVTWNGLPLNSLTSGSADLSLINVGGFSDVKINYGVAGSLYGSGTMGGVIELSNAPNWNKDLSASLKGEIGSFSSYNGSFQMSVSNQNLSYQGQVFYHDSKNDFSYIDVFDHGQPEETMAHNENSVIGTIHNFYWKTGRNLFDAGIWYQVKEKNIPGLMGVGPPVSHQTQKDSTLKLYIGWKRLIGNFRLEAKTAYAYDFLRYTDKETAESASYKIFSEIAAKQWLSNVSSRWYLHQNLSIDLDGRYSRLEGITSNYAENIVEHEGRLNAAVKYSPEFGVLIASVGKDWCTSEADELKVPISNDGEDNGYEIIKNSLPNPPLMFSFSAKAGVIPNWMALRAKIATHFRRPTFNDRYWVPGGNIHLIPEEGYNVEFGAELYEQMTWAGGFALDITYYWADNDESIAWKPIDGALWQPINTGAVVSKGVEVEMNHKLKFGSYSFTNKVVLGYNDAYDNSPESENFKAPLGYQPKYIFKINSNLIAAKWNIGTLLHSRSKCYTWEGREVEGYALLDVNAGYKLDVSNMDVHLMARVENVFDKSYQLVRAYPMPGRAFYLSVNINF